MKRWVVPDQDGDFPFLSRVEGGGGASGIPRPTWKEFHDCSPRPHNERKGGIVVRVDSECGVGRW